MGAISRRLAGRTFVLAALVASGGCDDSEGPPDGTANIEDGTIEPGPDSGLHIPRDGEALGPDSGPGDPDAATSLDDAAVSPEPGFADLVARIPEVQLTTSTVALSVGGLLRVAWTVRAAPAGSRLFFRLRKPGEPWTSGVGELRPGVAPASGPIGWLAVGGAFSWVEAEHGPAEDGEITFQLADEGEWRIHVYVREPGGGVVAGDDARVLLSSAPAMSLEISRTVAETGDRVQAALLTAAGSTPEPVEIVAWLEGPDGRQHFLPGGVQGMRAVHAGLSTNARLPLLDEALGSRGAGRWTLAARAFAIGGGLLASAEAVIQVCDEPGTLTGTVRDANGQPLAVDPARSVVAGLDIDDLEQSTATVAADGSWSLRVPPGRYAVWATVIAGGVEWRTEPESAVVGCGRPVAGSGGPPLNLDLRAAPTRSAAAASARPPRRYKSQRSGEPPPIVGMLYGGNIDEDTQELVFGAFSYRLVSPNRDIAVFSMQTIAGVVQWATLLQELGADSETTTLGVSDMLGKTEFWTTLTFERDETATIISFTLANAQTDVVELRLSERLAPNATDVMILEAVERLAARVPALGPFLRARRIRPLVPQITLRLDQTRVVQSDRITASVQVVEQSTREAAPDTPVEMCVEFPGVNRCELITTGGTGTATYPIVPTTPGYGLVRATFTRRGTPTSDTRRFVVEEQAGDVEIDSANGAVRFATRERLSVTLRRNGAPSPGHELRLRATGGELERPDGSTTPELTVRTSSTGTATVTFVAGNASMVGGATAESTTDPSLAGELRLVVDGMLTMDLGATPPTVLGGGFATVSVDVRTAGAPLAGVPVTLRAPGVGTLEGRGGHTDRDGHFETRWTAPASGGGAAVIGVTVVAQGQTLIGDVAVAYRAVPASDAGVSDGAARDSGAPWVPDPVGAWEGTWTVVSRCDRCPGTQCTREDHSTSLEVTGSGVPGTTGTAEWQSSAYNTWVFDIEFRPRGEIYGPGREVRHSNGTVSPASGEYLEMRALPPNQPGGLDRFEGGVVNLGSGVVCQDWELRMTR